MKKNLHTQALRVVSLISFGMILFSGSIAHAQSITLDEKGFGSTIHIVDVTDNKLALQGTDTVLEKELVDVIKGAINRVLGISGFIAVLLLMYGGIQMVTSAGNSDKYGEGFNILKNAAIGLAIIGFARFIVTIIFYVISISVESAKGTDALTTQ